MSMSAEDFLNSQGGIPGFKFKDAADKGVWKGGKVETFQIRQATKYGTSTPAVDDGGNPIMEMVIACLTDQGERAAFYCKAQMAQALRDAMIEAYGTVKAPEPGGQLMGQWYDSKPSQTKGHEPQKLYKFTYTPPAPAADPVVDRMKLA